MDLATLWTRLTDVSSTDPEDARRRVLLNILLVGTGLVTVLLLVFIGTYAVLGLAPTREDVLYPLVGSLVMLVGTVGLFFLNRYGRGWIAATLFLILITVAGGLTDPDLEQVVNGRSLVVLVIPILMASVLVRSWASFAMALVVGLFIALIGVVVNEVPNMFAVGILFLVALVSWLSSRSLERALGDVRRTNRELDQRVDERTRDLADALAREHGEASKNQAILTGIADGVIVFDEHGQAIVANPAIGHLLDRRLETIVGRDIQTLMGTDVDPEDKEVIAGMLRQQDAHRTSIKVEWGSKTLSVSFAPVRDASSRMTGSVAVFRDFSREAEVDRMKSDFVSIVSHEVRTPLTSIKGYLDLVLMGASGPVNMQQQSFLAIARDNSERLNELVTDLLDISRIESGKIELNVQVVSLPALVGQVVNALSKEYSDRGLSLDVDIPADLPEVFGDSGRITQVIYNLLSNAFKYTIQGGTTIRARVAGNAVQIDVVDTGIGISPSDQEKLFSRFFRADDSRVRQQPGTGLGLHITKSLVEMHGGRIWLDSRPGEGSTFSFTLPLPVGLVPPIAAEIRKSPAPPLAPPGPAPTGPCILVVDDDKDIVGWLKEVLARHGFQTKEAYDGLAALRAVEASRPDLILLDLRMPRMDGRETIRRLREKEETRDIPIIVLTAGEHSGAEERAQMLGLGAQELLHKPVPVGQLVAAVRKHLPRG